ncbi:MAG: HEAT repeat domain-containing protein, partial [bacterium]|nr:HEAT repeat domain-containing protein [bacterium]
MANRILSIELVAIALAALLFLILAALGAVALLRGTLRGRSLRVESLLRRHRGLVDALVRGDEEQRPLLLARLESLGDVKRSEALLDQAAEREGMDDAALRDFYDVAGVTGRYLEMLKQSNSWKRRAFAASKLGRIGSVTAVPALLKLVRDVEDEDEDVRHAALRAVGRIRDASAIPFLIEALGFPETWLAPRIAEILICFGDEVIDPLIEELRNLESESRRVWAADILGWLEADGALFPLIEALEDISPEVRARAVGALGKLGDEAALGK